MFGLIRYLTDYEATVRANGNNVAEIISNSGGYLFSLQPEGYYETPTLSIDDARECLSNLETVS